VAGMAAIGAVSYTLVDTLGQVASPSPEPASGMHGMHGSPTSAPPTPANTPTPFIGTTGQPLVEPEVRQSVNGVLETAFEAKLTQTTVAGQTVTAMVYEGSYPGPTLRIKPGEILKLDLTNSLDQCTNLHTHGFHVSPRDNSDNIFVEIAPGDTFSYEYHVPENNYPGLFYYHPHCHGFTSEQATSGMGGVIIVAGGLDDLPSIKDLTRRVLVLQASQFDGSGNLVPQSQQTNASRMRFVNGQLEPTISIAPGETQVWKIANVSSDDFFLLSLSGHQLVQIAKDANAYAAPVARDQILLGPSERIEAMVQASSTPGSYEFRSLQWGPDYQAEPDVLLATMVVGGDPVTPMALPTTLIPFLDLRDVPVDFTRTTTFEEPGAPLYLAIDGKHFDPDRIDQAPILGTTEEWVIRNTGPHFHPFHIHVNDFQITAINGEPYDAPSYNDTVVLPPMGEVTMRTQFLDYSGKFVYHCHILSHEDFGMMATVEVIEPGAPTPEVAPVVPVDAGTPAARSAAGAPD
jgi:FtsP/CotA-like multicopper oxidase with cupredoxin domain